MADIGTWIVVAISAGVIFYVYKAQGSGGIDLTLSDMLLLASSIIMGALLVTILR